MSFDPHIDIDELDDPLPAAPAPFSSTSSTSSDPQATDWDSGEPAGLLSMGDTFYMLLKQMRAWQERVTPGNSRSFIPGRINKHLRAAQREFLLAWRGLIDLSLERLDRQEQEEQAQNNNEPPA